jgi:hypothetical protein
LQIGHCITGSKERKGARIAASNRILQQDVAGSQVSGRICTDEQAKDEMRDTPRNGKTAAGSAVIKGKMERSG